MDAEELIRRLAAALAIGLLVGTERHWRERQEAAGRRTAGVRTFALTGLLGGVMAVLALALGQPGGALLLGSGERLFTSLVPWLILLGSALVALQKWLAETTYILPIRFRAVELLTSSRVTQVAPMLVDEPESYLRAVLSFRLATP